LSDNLRVMSRDMKQEKLTDKERDQLQARMRDMNKLMEKIQQASVPAP
jgi:hypothetical protein